MTRFYVAFAVVLVMTLSAVGVSQLLDADPEHAQPPHAARPTAGVAIGPLPLAFMGAEHPGEVITAVQAWVEGELRHAEELAAAAAAAEEAARLEAARRTPSQPVARTGTSTPGTCDGIDWAIPVGLVVRESKCNFDAQSPASFCGGYGCVGAYQFDSRHWDPNSWGGCADLGDWRDPEAQHECARRLSRGGTNLAPWGG